MFYKRYVWNKRAEKERESIVDPFVEQSLKPRLIELFISNWFSFCRMKISLRTREGEGGEEGKAARFFSRNYERLEKAVNEASQPFEDCNLQSFCFIARVLAKRWQVRR